MDIFDAKTALKINLLTYKFVFVDEAQRIYAELLDKIIDETFSESITCVFSYDFFQVL